MAMRSAAAITYVDRLECPIVEESVLFVVYGTQIVGDMVSQCLQIECMLRYYNHWTFQRLIRRFRYHLHVTIARSMYFNGQCCMVTG